LPQDGENKGKEDIEVLPIDAPGGPEWTIDRTFSLRFSLAT